MPKPRPPKLALAGQYSFKMRFNRAHGDTGLFWKVFLTDMVTKRETMHFVASVSCLVPCFSIGEDIDNTKHFSLAGQCSNFIIDASGNALFLNQV